MPLSFHLRHTLHRLVALAALAVLALCVIGASPLLTAPANLTAAPASGGIRLTWGPVSGATSYAIFRGTASHSENATPYATGVTSLTFLNTHVTSGVVYYYQIAAVSAGGVGPRSNEAASSTKNAVVIAAPTPVPTKEHSNSSSSNTGALVILLIALAAIAGGAGIWLWRRAAPRASLARSADQPIIGETPDEIFPDEEGISSSIAISAMPTTPRLPGSRASEDRPPHWPVESRRPGSAGDEPLPTGAIIALVMIVLGVAGVAAFAFLTIFGGSGNSTVIIANQATATPTATVTPTASATSSPTPTATSIASNGIAISAGGDQIGNFMADTDFTGGSTYSANVPIDTSGVANPAPEQVYQAERFGDFTYTIPNLTPGAHYLVRLHFAEIYFTQTGQRVFNVSINGQPELQNFDIVAAAGGPRRAVVEQFTIAADSSGQIVIAFTHGPNNNPKVSGLEIIPTS